MQQLVLKDFELELTPNYSRSGYDRLRWTVEELKEVVRRIRNWDNVRLQKDIDEKVRAYDAFATRVYVDENHIANIDYLNSPFIHMLLDFAQDGLLTLNLRASYFEGVAPGGKIAFKIKLHVQVLTDPKLTPDLVKTLQDFKIRDPHPETLIDIDEYTLTGIGGKPFAKK